jgi:ABC-type multidrug transport system fused ATPase/permease subunit
VAALLQRLYSPDAGAIMLGGADIASFTRREWTAAMAAVSQEPVLFPASIAYNIGAKHGRRGWGAALWTAVAAAGDGPPLALSLW